jgi:hypothetical protein
MRRETSKYPPSFRRKRHGFFLRTLLVCRVAQKGIFIFSSLLQPPTTMTAKRPSVRRPLYGVPSQPRNCMEIHVVVEVTLYRCSVRVPDNPNLESNSTMNATRHNLTKEMLNLPAPIQAVVGAAESLEKTGNWYLAGETYRQAAGHADALSPEIRAKLLARAAGCFDVARQDRAAARAYFDAASQLHNNNVRFQVAGELFNRAALLFRSIGEYFNAGDSWRRAGSAFTQVPDDVISTSDNIPPVPLAAGRFTVAANCYTAGGD